MNVPKRPFKLGITGGIAEGKSTVLAYCREAGWDTCSLDDMARELFFAEDVQAELARLLDTALPVERTELRQALTSDAGVRRGVNRIMHPRLLRVLRESKASVFEVPLLIETCMLAEFDRIWVVSCGPEEQLRRLSTRLGEAEARALVSTQLPTVAKMVFADAVIRTNKPEQHVKRSVFGFLEFRHANT